MGGIQLNPNPVQYLVDVVDDCHDFLLSYVDVPACLRQVGGTFYVSGSNDRFLMNK